MQKWHFIHNPDHIIQKMLQKIKHKLLYLFPVCCKGEERKVEKKEKKHSLTVFFT